MISTTHVLIFQIVSNEIKPHPYMSLGDFELRLWKFMETEVFQKYLKKFKS